MSDMFERPSNDFWAAKDYAGKLHIFENIGQPYETVTSSNKPGETSTAIDADVTVLDADGGPKEFRKARVFGQAIVGALSRVNPGKPMLARIQQGQASPGKNPPWLLVDYTDADAQLAGAYLTQRAAGQFQAPAPATPAPAAPAIQTGQAGAPNLNDPAVQAALAALAAGGVTAQSAEAPF
jgi:hypothetical protein